MLTNRILSRSAVFATAPSLQLGRFWCVCCTVVVAGQLVAAWPEPTPQLREIILGRWSIPKSGNVSIEFTKDEQFRIRHDDKLVYKGQYEVFESDSEIGLNRIQSGNGKTMGFPYMTGARAQVVIKLRQDEESLILERPKIPEWSLKIGTVRVPPDKDVRLRLVRVLERTK